MSIEDTIKMLHREQEQVNLVLIAKDDAVSAYWRRVHALAHLRVKAIEECNALEGTWKLSGDFGHSRFSNFQLHKSDVRPYDALMQILPTDYIILCTSDSGDVVLQRDSDGDYTIMFDYTNDNLDSIMEFCDKYHIIVSLSREFLMKIDAGIAQKLEMISKLKACRSLFGNPQMIVKIR